jgi:hypothetical protein
VSREEEIHGLDFTQGLKAPRLHKFSAMMRGEYPHGAPLPRNAEGAQHGSRDADLVLHGRPSLPALHQHHQEQQQQQQQHLHQQPVFSPVNPQQQ